MFLYILTEDPSGLCIKYSPIYKKMFTDIVPTLFFNWQYLLNIKIE